LGYVGWGLGVGDVLVVTGVEEGVQVEVEVFSMDYWVGQEGTFYVVLG